MKSLSFKSIYAIPHSNTQNHMVKKHMDIMIETAALRDTSKKYKYDAIKDISFVYIRDENDKKFENYASRYGIHYRKANVEELNNAVDIDPKYEISTEGNLKNITLYDAKGKEVFARYTIGKSKDGEEKLVKKEEFLDGKSNCIHEYDDNGNYKKSIINGDNVKFEFNYDKNGKPIIKI